MAFTLRFWVEHIFRLKVVHVTVDPRGSAGLIYILYVPGLHRIVRTVGTGFPYF